MPSYLHEGVLELFRADLTSAATLIAEVCDVSVPGYTGATTEQCDFSDICPKEFRGDLALSLHDADGAPVLGMCVEDPGTHAGERAGCCDVMQPGLSVALDGCDRPPGLVSNQHVALPQCCTTVRISVSAELGTGAALVHTVRDAPTDRCASPARIPPGTGVASEVSASMRSAS